MTITPATTAISQQHAAAQASAPRPEAREVGPDHDGDADDRGTQVKAAAPAPTLNTLGEITGSSISTKA